MLETRAVVVEVEHRYAQVQAHQGNGCSVCNGKGCGSGKLTQLFCSKPRQFRVDNRINASVGDQVIVSVPEGAVLRGVGLVYLLPLVLLFGGASWAGSWAVQEGQRDAYSAAGALSGLLIGFLFAKGYSARQRQQTPYISRQFSE
ncbi:MAG: SoxR reducing system RseC family protein [Gallionella sp.]|jgi:sigma-E factor negative regulatory protein RseC